MAFRVHIGYLDLTLEMWLSISCMFCGRQDLILLLFKILFFSSCILNYYFSLVSQGSSLSLKKDHFSNLHFLIGFTHHPEPSHFPIHEQIFLRFKYLCFPCALLVLWSVPFQSNETSPWISFPGLLCDLWEILFQPFEFRFDLISLWSPFWEFIHKLTFRFEPQQSYK